MRRSAAPLVVALLTLAACGSGGVDDARPAVDDLWAEEGDLVEVEAPDPLLLPGPGLPDGAVLTHVERPDPTYEAPTSAEALEQVLNPAQTVYADPGADDPARGRSLTVGRSWEGDVETGLWWPDGSVPLALPGVEGGRVGRFGDAWLVGWDLPIDHDCGCQQEGFVLGRGVDRGSVVAAARAAEVLGPRPSLPAAARPGLRSLGTTSGVGDRVPGPGPRPQVLTVRLPAGEVRVVVHRADPRLVVHAGIWAPDGKLPGLGARVVHAARPDGAYVMARSRDDVTVAQLEAVVASVVPATDADVEAALDHLAAEVPLADCFDADPSDLVVPDERPSLRGTTPDGGRWVVGIAWDGEVLNTCSTVAARGAEGMHGGSGGPAAIITDAPVALVGGHATLTHPGAYRAVVGHVVEGAAAVEVRTRGLPTVPAVLADAGPVPGRVWFAALVDVTPLGLHLPAIEAVALTPDGTELARTPPP